MERSIFYAHLAYEAGATGTRAARTSKIRSLCGMRLNFENATEPACMCIFGSVKDPVVPQRLCHPIKRLNFVEPTCQFQLPRCLPGKPDFVAGQTVNLYKPKIAA